MSSRTEQLRAEALALSGGERLERLDRALDALEEAVRESERLAVVKRVREHVWSSSLNQRTRDLLFHLILEKS